MVRPVGVFPEHVTVLVPVVAHCAIACSVHRQNNSIASMNQAGLSRSALAHADLCVYRMAAV
jgi:hypothetical protein